MSYSLSPEKMDGILQELKKNYRVYAPVRFENMGRYSDTDLIRYDEIESVEDIVFDEKSDFSPKEIIHPVTQTLFHFTEHDFRESQIDDRDLLIFARPCDINGIKRLDNIFLENGDHVDIYYKRLRDKVKFVLMECQESMDTCFCVSMNTNKTDDYSLAVRYDGDQVMVEVNDDSFAELFTEKEEVEFSPQFITSNLLEVNIPAIDSQELISQIHELDMWETYNSRCESCGGCTSACVTCSCFTTSDVIYSENGRAGERRRIWSSCLHDDFSRIATGESYRNTPGERMRFRVLHKIHDFKEKFGEHHMCVGCGRCSERCPELISFAAAINRLHDRVEDLKNKKTAVSREG